MLQLLAHSVRADSRLHGHAKSGLSWKDLFVPIPARGERYRVVFELYRDVARADRLALFETAAFQG